MPLAGHVLIHGAMTLVICVNYGPLSTAIWLALFDASIHFVMDRIKASPKYMGRWKVLSAGEWPTATPEKKRANNIFWSCLGIDQMVHHLTHYAIIWVLLH